MRMFNRIILAILALVLMVGVAYAGQVTLAWDANAESENVSGYKIHWGLSTGNYTTHIDVGNVTQYVATDLPEGVSIFFAATAYRLSDNTESGYSNEVMTILNPPQGVVPNSPTGFRIIP